MIVCITENTKIQSIKKLMNNLTDSVLSNKRNSDKIENMNQ